MSTWRQKFKVHPAADVFPMMPDDELAKLAEDIKANGLKERVHFWRNELVDGRNRMQAMEIAGIEVRTEHKHGLNYDADPVAYIISKNIRRRHLTSGQLADVLVKLARIEVKKETGSSEPVSESKGGRGKKSALKAKAIEINAAFPQEQRISESSIKRSIAKAEGKKPKSRAASPSRIGPSTVEGWRRGYINACSIGCPDLDAEQEIIRFQFALW